jgi:adenylate cyclase
MSAETAYRFGDFVLDASRGALLSITGEEIPLRPKSFALLQLLVENAGRLLSRDAINRTIWAHVTVTDDAITQCIREIRRALSDDAQCWVKTVPRRGVVFGGEVRSDREILEPHQVPVNDKPSVAVLPFVNLSGDTDEEYFSEGIANDIITRLSRSPSLFVIARASSFSYRDRTLDVKQIGHELGVRYLVEGSVSREAARVRVHAQLVSAVTRAHLWAERYDRELPGLFAIQDEIAVAVAAAVLPAMSEAEQQRALHLPMHQLGAWEAYQRGLWHMSKFGGGDVQLARGYLEQAIELDRTFVAARSHLAMIYIEEGYIYGTRSPAEAIALAERVISTAIEHDSGDAEAQATTAFATMVKGGDTNVAERLVLARVNNPNSPWANGLYGAYLAWRGRPAEGRKYLRLALRLSPRDSRNAWFWHQVAVSYYFERLYAKAAETARWAIALHHGYPQPHRWLAAALGQLGRSTEAREALCRAKNASPAGFELYVRGRPAWFRPEQHEHLLDGLRKAGWRSDE